MPGRKPLGTYTRSTASWYTHQRGRASGWATLNPASPNNLAIGLQNLDSRGWVCHILGLKIWLAWNAAQSVTPSVNFPPIVNGFYFTSIPPLAGPDAGFANPTEPYFDLDPVPAQQLVLGELPNVANPYYTATMIPLKISLGDVFSSGESLIYYASSDYSPELELAAFKPPRGFALAAFNTGYVSMGVQFDFVVLPD